MERMRHVEAEIMVQDSVAKRRADFESFELECKSNPLLHRPITTLEIIQEIHTRETEQHNPTSKYYQQQISISSPLIAAYVACFKEYMRAQRQLVQQIAVAVGFLVVLKFFCNISLTA